LQSEELFQALRKKSRATGSWQGWALIGPVSRVPRPFVK